MATRFARTSSMMPSDQEYLDHLIFEDMDFYISFYESLSFSVFSYITIGTRAICNIDSYVLSSIQGTLTSIRTVARDGYINDAYALLRKYYDSLIISIYANLYLDDRSNHEHLIVKQIDNWMQGKDHLPEYRNMLKYIRDSSSVSAVTSALLTDDRYKHIRDRCNDHTHYNFFHCMLLNDPEIHNPGLRMALDDLADDLRDLIILYMSYTFVAKQHYMASSDYMDCLECGIAPEPDSQYWVAPFVQDAFDKIIVPHRPDIAELIKRDTSMHLK